MKKLYFIFCCISCLLLCGCTEETQLPGKEVPENGFILNYTIDSPTALRSIVPAEPEENTITSMYILFFEPSSNGMGKFIDIYMAELENQITNGEFGSLPINFSDNRYQKLQTNKDYNLLVATNVEFYTRAKDFDEDEDEIDLEKLRVYFKEVLDGFTEKQAIEATYLRLDKGILENDHLPMSGVVSRRAGETNVEVQLTRCICRIDVVNNDSRYELVNASLWNVFSRTTIWGGRFQRYEDGEIVNKFAMSFPDPGSDAGANAIKGRMYAFENYVVDPEQDDKITTCLIVGLKPVGKEKTEYYRINISVGDAGQQLKRNNLYQVNINSVLGNGEGTPEEAYENSKMLISNDINGWNVDDSGSILFDGENILAVPFSRVNFLPGGDTFKCNIFTHGTGKLEKTNWFLPANINAELVGNELVIVAGPSRDEQQGIVEVGFGNLRATIYITQRGATTEFLEVNPTGLENFPSVLDTATGNPSETLTVDASGGWYAEIFSNTQENIFSFTRDRDKLELRSDEVIANNFNIYLRQPNKKEYPLYGFVLFTLKSNPKISRVILLTQEGAGGISLSPSGTFAFDPYGKVEDEASTDKYSITVSPADGVGVIDWKVTRVSGPDKFELVKDGNQLTVKAKEQNQTGSEYRSVYRVHLTDNESRFKEITLTQAPHSLALDPPGGFGHVPTSGGKTATITVTSSGPWTATIIDNPHTLPFFEGTTSMVTSGYSGGKFTVIFPPLSINQVIPYATVEIRVTGTDIARKITFEQNPVATRVLHFYGWGTYGNIAYPGSVYNTSHVKQISDNIRNTRWFGPGGVVDMPGYTFTRYTNTTRTVPNDADIYQSNYVEVNATHASNIAKWLKDSDKRIYFFAHDNNNNSSLRNLISAGAIPSGYVSERRGTSKTELSELHPNFLNTKLYDYLLSSGPFTNGGTPVKEVRLRSYNNSNSYLNAWPDTFIPILMAPGADNTKLCGFGIDPVNRFIFLGDIDMFGNYGASSVNYSGGPYSENNMKFLNNFIAWMTCAALYGDDFIQPFKIGLPK